MFGVIGSLSLTHLGYIVFHLDELVDIRNFDITDAQLPGQNRAAEFLRGRTVVLAHLPAQFVHSRRLVSGYRNMGNYKGLEVSIIDRNRPDQTGHNGAAGGRVIEKNAVVTKIGDELND